MSEAEDVLKCNLSNKRYRFIYNLYQSSGLPWVYGGEYVEFVRLVKEVVESWIKVGLQVYFVFDGLWSPC